VHNLEQSLTTFSIKKTLTSMFVDDGEDEIALEKLPNNIIIAGANESELLEKL